MRLLSESDERNEFLTGLIYLDPEKPDFIDMQGVTDSPVAHLPDEATRPSRDTLEAILTTI